MKYKVIERKNPQNRLQSKFYVNPIRNSTLGRSHIKNYLVEKTALSKAKARGVTVTLVDFIKEELLKGNAVNIEGLGTFSIRVRSEGSDTLHEVSAKNVKNVIINYRPAIELNNAVKKSVSRKLMTDWACFN